MKDLSLLVISEDPSLIHTAAQLLRPHGTRVVGCLGPLHSRCSLLERGTCPLAATATVALVDSPSSGGFRRRLSEVPSALYAETLQAAHPDCTVVLGGGSSHNSGEDVVRATSSISALALLCALMESRSDVTALGDPTERRAR